MSSLDNNTRVFPLARVAGMLRWTTYVVLLLPLLFGFGIFVSGPQQLIMIGLFIFIILIYGSVWFYWRPSRFEITNEHLTLIFPLRTIVVPRDTIISVRPLSRAEFKERYGRAYRVGAGGLWGGFGWLKTSKHGFVEFYISHMESWVLIERKGARDLLITPTQPNDFVAALTR